MEQQELTREEFRNAILKRDNYKCVICGEAGSFNKDKEMTVNEFFTKHDRHN